MTSLQAQNIALTPLTAEDAPLLLAWINDRSLVLNNAPFKPVHGEAHRQWFTAIQTQADVRIFGIRLLATQALIGTCQLHSIHPVHRSAELQIRIGVAAARGKGYGTEAVKLLLSHAFRDLNLHRVYLHVFAENPAALRTYEKTGFRQEGILRQGAYLDGQYRDVVVMGILQEEFAGLTP